MMIVSPPSAREGSPVRSSMASLRRLFSKQRHSPSSAETDDLSSHRDETEKSQMMQERVPSNVPGSFLMNSSSPSKISSRVLFDDDSSHGVDGSHLSFSPSLPESVETSYQKRDPDVILVKDLFENSSQCSEATDSSVPTMQQTLTHEAALRSNLSGHRHSLLPAETYARPTHCDEPESIQSVHCRSQSQPVSILPPIDPDSFRNVRDEQRKRMPHNVSFDRSCKEGKGTHKKGVSFPSIKPSGLCETNAPNETQTCAPSFSNGATPLCLESSNRMLYPGALSEHESSVRIRPELLEDDFDEYFDEVLSSVNDRHRFGDWNEESGNAKDKKDQWNDALSRMLLGLGPGAGESMDNKSVDNDGSPSRRSALQERKRRKERKTTTEEKLKQRLKEREDAAVAVLRGKHGFPTGLARLCHRVSLHQLPLRVWVVDNSGSMATGDGRKFVDGTKKMRIAHGRKGRGRAGQVSQMINCTRWEELRATVMFHAELASDLGAPTIFRLMNDPNVAIAARLQELEGLGEIYNVDSESVLPQVVGICARRAFVLKQTDSKRNTDPLVSQKGVLGSLFTRSREIRNVTKYEDEPCEWEGVWEVDRGAIDGSDAHWVERAQQDLELVRHVMQETEPRYRTPLARHMWAVHDQVKSMMPYLKPHQKVAIIVATDGLPNEPESFLDAMYLIQKLPVYLIIRLCTDDEASMHFWNTLDLDIDIPIEILDDFEAEAGAVFSMNPWVNYCLPIQRIREWGYRSPLLECLRERPLTCDELRDFCALIFGVPASCLPNPIRNWEEFYSDVEALLKRESRQWNPLLKRTKGWIDIKKMAELYGGKAEHVRQKKERRLKKQRRIERERSRKRQSMKKTKKSLLSRLLGRVRAAGNVSKI